MITQYNILNTEPVLLSKLKAPTSHKFTPWKLNLKTYELEFAGGIYAIPLGEIRNSSIMLDWIFQLNRKTWTTPLIMKKLLDALQYFLDPQANYCPWEEDLRVENPRELIERRLV